MYYNVHCKRKVFIDPAEPLQGFCKPGFKMDEKSRICVQITNEDILVALHWLASPPKVPQICRKRTTVQGIVVCEDYLANNGECVVLSIISTIFCDFYGSLEFEKYWSSRCKVFLFQFTLGFKGNACSLILDPTFPDGTKRIGAEGGSGQFYNYPNITVIRNDLWGARCFNCLYRTLINVNTLISNYSKFSQVDILKIQARDGVYEDMEGVQFSILSDLYIHKFHLAQQINQIVFTSAINSITMQDNLGREGEMAWNFWGTIKFLSNFGAYYSGAEQGRVEPLQFGFWLDRANVSMKYSYYHHSFVRLDLLLNQTEAIIIRSISSEWKPPPTSTRLKANVPAYCHVPSLRDDELMQKWINEEINARCHPNRLWVVCDRSRTYDAFVPCPQELMNKLSEDFAVQNGWCDFTHDAAVVPWLVNVDPRAAQAFSKPQLSKLNPGVGGLTIRLAFLLTIYTDELLVERLLKRLYSPEHYFLLHVDPAGASLEFKKFVFKLAESYPAQNVFISNDVPIVYGSSTATILLSKSMSWFVRFTSGWDYFVPITGSDYPLLPLRQIEKILSFQNPPMPFVMAWTPGTSTHIFRLEKTHSIFETDPLLKLSIKTVLDERGKVLGAVPMEYRSTNFGPPLLCNGKKSFYHLDNRRNKSGMAFDTQWLFPRDKIPGRGRAYPDEVSADTTSSFDNVFRVWKKSDPATTGAYDRESVQYIVQSVEGKKYYHFFKHMLLGSEEHYYVSLLYNWKRTKSFVQTLSAQAVWNTWELGLWEQATGFQTHTHFLSPAEWTRLQGFSKRGMFFARKFSTKKTPEILNMIDSYILRNISTDAGTFWPGFLHVDTWSPGKLWVSEYHKNESIRNIKNRHSSRTKARLRGF